MASLQAEVDLASDPIVLKCRIPPGVEVKATAYGLGVFATASYSKDETVFRGECWEVPFSPKNIIGLFHDSQTDEEKSYAMDVITHSVNTLEGTRHLYSFDGFMNHSCSPNSFSFYLTEEGEGEGERKQRLIYDTIALRSIQIGDEITCDYNTIEWDFADEAISECECGSPGCHKEIKGMKYLSTEDQLSLLPYSSAMVRTLWASAHPNTPLPRSVCGLSE
jgi:hypothetical protein